MPDIRCIAVVGTGAMGTGIAQIAAQAGLTVWLFDSRAEAAAEARQRLRQTFESLCGKGKLSAADAEAAQNRLRVAERLEQLGDCELVVEAIVERLEAKQELLRRLEAIVAPETILASNTSSLSITAIAAACERPQRVAGFRMGPFELLDLTGLDVSHPVMESIYQQYYQEPRYRPHPLTRQLLAAGRLGRKSGQGFYRYVDGQPQDKPGPQPVPQAAARPPVWLGCENEDDRRTLAELLHRLGVEPETGERPSAAALCLLAAWGEDLSSAVQRFACPAERSVGIDLLCDLERRRCLMLSPLTIPAMRDAAHALLAGDGVGVTVLRDSPGFVVQRVLAMIVNLACDIAQQGIASVEDIDQAVHLGLGYPHGPLEWGDRLGPRRLLSILQRLQTLTGDPRYRPSPWLRRRAQLGISLRAGETAAVG
ncbi:TPA: 3-hydroxyacyl-CoA dehydrogenase [Pseudomonas aeruginosa]|nr:3-hydroxyacyl-CoA dehydrogenase family protein [Pseudomonas aeruginosa]HBO2112342.1 3-hydroxyacyl-CoA dehydrogenase [Pseudomonas aeruginosa]HCF5442528.1 3-hydroxyacyl-CoA dehydrogenase [Pseudomonas aeruginosa]HEJ4447757.1 3-hydroxyacyl-CoA dehydrogenase [Pseudomonas aeruginosa]HEJ6602868.1 3-hydroxyacyl-CoA dehydrogenase [Pseudomonas aeruginosa]